MTTAQSLVLGIVQGLTEFLPVSSTAHLRVLPYFLGWEDPGAAFSAAVQLGTLAAVFIYFAGDIKRLIAAAWEGLRLRDLRHSQDSLVAWAIVPGTLPIAVFGLGFRDFIETEARGLSIVASALIGGAVMLLIAEKAGKRDRGMESLGFWRIQFIGLCQALALIPGSSRSGVTIAGGLLAGLHRKEAARFSFILGLPAIAASGLLQLLELMRGESERSPQSRRRHRRGRGQRLPGDRFPPQFPRAPRNPRLRRLPPRTGGGPHGDEFRLAGMSRRIRATAAARPAKASWSCTIQKIRLPAPARPRDAACRDQLHQPR